MIILVLAVLLVITTVLVWSERSARRAEYEHIRIASNRFDLRRLKDFNDPIVQTASHTDMVHNYVQQILTILPKEVASVTIGNVTVITNRDGSVNWGYADLRNFILGFRTATQMLDTN